MNAPARARIGACQGCGACLLTCPEHAIRPGPDGDRRLLVADTCTGCGDCVEVCPVDVIDLVAADGSGILGAEVLRWPNRAKRG